MLRTSGFVDDVTFAHHRRGKGGASRASAESDSPGGSTGPGRSLMSTIALCLLRLGFSAGQRRCLSAREPRQSTGVPAGGRQNVHGRSIPSVSCRGTASPQDARDR